MEFAKRILCIGAGYVGGPTMAIIAAKCRQYRVTVVDINGEKIDQWNSDNLPIYEPGLDQIVKTVRNRNLYFSKDINRNIKEADIIFVSVNTPTKDYGQGAGKAADLQYWEKTARQIAEQSDAGKIVVEKSTVPVRTAAAIERILQSNGHKVEFNVISNPEFLSEGSAIRDLERPDRVLIGSKDDSLDVWARKQIVGIYANWVPPEKIIESDVWSVELSKLTANAFLAQRISSINSISAICEKTGADIEQVAYAIGSDRRIGADFLKAGVGFGGSCFKKDILNLVYLCESYGLTEVAQYWESVVRINEWQEMRFVRNMIHNMFNTIAEKRIALFGFAFKANTGDTRESPALYVAKALLEERAEIVISDPRALEGARTDLGGFSSRIEFEEDPYRAAEKAHGIAVLTEWEEYRRLDYERILRHMMKPAFIFDGRNTLDHNLLFNLGFNVFAIGKPALKHFV